MFVIGLKSFKSLLRDTRILVNQIHLRGLTMKELRLGANTTKYYIMTTL